MSSTLIDEIFTKADITKFANMVILIIVHAMHGFCTTGTLVFILHFV